MSQVRTVADENGDEAESRLLRCVECGDVCAARAEDDGTLVPLLGTPGGRCPACNGAVFEQVVLDLGPDGD
jgi:hypothetical protein